MENIYGLHSLSSFQFAYNKCIDIQFRIAPNANGQVNGSGGTGGLARWNVHLDGESDGYKVAKFQNTKTNKYLRIYNDGNTIDVGGGGGKWTRFKVKQTNGNSFKLESCELGGKYVAIQPKGAAIGNGMFRFCVYSPSEINLMQMICRR